MKTATASLSLLLILICAACQQPSVQPAPEEAVESDVPSIVEGTATAADGLHLVYDVRGSGDTALVFVHGWACDRTYWRGQLDHFAATFQVVSVDLAGHGASGKDREHWSVADLGADVAALAGELQLDRIVLVGHSMGGPVSLFAARLMPERVIGIVCADTLHNVEAAPPAEQMEQIATSFEEDFTGTMGLMAQSTFAEDADPELVAWVAERAGAADPGVAIALFRGFADLDLKAALAAVDVPVRAINKAPQNEHDPVTAIEVNRKYGDFDAVLMEGVGHFLILEQPDEFNTILEKVLEEIMSQQPAGT